MACQGCGAVLFLLKKPVSYTHLDVYKRQVKSSEMKIPLYIQSDYSKVKYGNSNLAVCGDGPTCLAMIASYKTGKTVTPAEIVKWCGNKMCIRDRSCDML